MYNSYKLVLKKCLIEKIYFLLVCNKKDFLSTADSNLLNHFLYSQWSALATSLPKNVHLLTLEQFRHTGPVPSPGPSVPYLIRFEHFYEKGEDASLSNPVTFDIQVSHFHVCDSGVE